MTRRSHLAAWLLLWLVGLVVWPLWAGPERLAERARDGIAAVRGTFGDRTAAHLLRAADGAQQVFGHTGVGDLLAGHVAPREGSRHLPVATRLAVDRAERYLAALRLQFHGTVLRAAALLAWGVLLLPLAVAAAVDGFTERAIKADTFGYQNPAAFTLAGHTLIACAMLPVVALVLPVSLPPWLTPAWAAVVLLPLRVALAHMQPVFTR